MLELCFIFFECNWLSCDSAIRLSYVYALFVSGSTTRRCLYNSNYILTVMAVVESIAPSSNDDVTIAHLCCVIHVFHIASRYSALLLKLTVKDHGTSVTTATPELLVDDAQTPRLAWKLRGAVFMPRQATRPPQTPTRERHSLKHHVRDLIFVS